jgi:uncharacterized protein YdhG (YjbR/CyaY superfamily)
MKSKTPSNTNVDAYISQFPVDVQAQLQQLRKVIHAVAPDANEKISYGIPTFCLHGNLVHFAAYRNHIGFYPSSSGVLAFAQELSAYKTSRGTVQFPLGQPLPVELIKKIVAFRVTENLTAVKGL